MLKQLLLMGILIVFYAGCTTKKETRLDSSFKKTIDASALMKKTEKINISQGNEVKLSLSITYLNGEESIMDKNNTVREKFIVNLYESEAISDRGIEQGGDINGSGLIGNGQTLMLNIQYPETDKELSRAQKAKRDRGVDRLPLKVRKISLTDPLLKNIPMVNKWSSYYYVEFPHTRRDKFSLIYQNRRVSRKLAKETATEPHYTKYQLTFTKREKYLYQTNKKLY